MFCFGITMRLTNAVDYDEPRESIASDWNNYMLSAFPESNFIYIPNIEENVVDYISKLKVNVLVLSGGDDIGITPRRDDTELLALKYALKEKIPVIAICRGLQLIHTYFGGEIKKGNEEFISNHKAENHLIKVNGEAQQVNSFHSNCLVENTISNKFKIYARCKNDNTIEGIMNNDILAMMWHPERDYNNNKWNKKLIQDFLDNHKKKN